MPKSRYSEEAAVQIPAGELLRDKLGWDLFYCYDEEALGANGTLGRNSYDEVLLERDLLDALVELNEHLSEEECEQALANLKEVFVGDTLLATNEKKYEMLKNGIPVQRRLPDGSARTDRAQVFDFEFPQNNHFVAAEELWVKGPMHRRRCDLVGFVNGVPLLFVEFKRHDKDVYVAYKDNYSDYQDTIPQIFYYNAIVMLSNGLESKVGTLGSPYEFFHEWKRLRESDAGSVALETMLLGICKKENLLDLFENFILFDHYDTPAAKILARNHQYLGVNDAIEAYKERELREGRLGVFWHTQGSGKSYSMVFLAEKIRRKFAGSPTFLVLTDREELDKQISETFESCGCLSGVPAERCRATSGKDLIEKLRGNPSYVFSLIQKFNQEDVEAIHPEHDIVILSDEAHRSNNGICAENMMRLLPTASRIGFTGTPILEYDSLTSRTFGGYVSVYDFNRAVEDGATVPLFYENRSDKLQIDNPELDDKLMDAVEEADLDPEQTERVERELAHGVHVIMSEPRLREIAKDFVGHYTGIWESGKAMFICVNKVTTVMMFDFVQEYWADSIKEEERKLNGMGQQEALEQQRKIDWMRSTEMAVVISQEQNEIANFDKWGLDIRPHRKKMEERRLDDEFKDADNPLRIVFVCAMWLTGFDVKPLAAMYFDKPMKAHGLMQAIARANRVAEGKSNGLIVDYIGVVKALRKALADYTNNVSGKEGEDPVIDKDELIVRIAELTREIEFFLEDKGFELEALFAAEGFDKISQVKNAADALSVTDESKKHFGIMARELFKMYKFVTTKEVEPSLLKSHDAIRAIYAQLNKRVEHADTTDLMVELQRIVDDHINVCKTDEEQKSGTRFDISGIDFSRLSQEFAKAKRPHLMLDELRDVIEARLLIALKENPRRIDFFERYERIIECYNSEQDKATIERTFNDLMRLSCELDEKQKEWIREGFESPRQMTVFEMLFKDDLTKEEIRKVKAIAIDLSATIEERLAAMVRWTEKAETREQIRIIIRDKVWQLPERCYPDADLPHRVEEIYDLFYNQARAA
ncbi:type I restriction endonuclease subunit R [uncultured Adlercreutzia sp.]|uniref:type I restriction endonuclease subunit R n=1 Tax=uncultured Adlercreutzia sp. TaxID=875803 RepID=UPI0025CB9802|nr:type I restriction endonuclease subunit R [uncultured Adlercreutzia sp.]